MPQRLIPEAKWLGNALWINNSNRRNQASLIENWLISIDYNSLPTWADGDINQDGEINIGDVTSLIDIVLSGNIHYPGADVNGDNEVNVSDVTKLIDMILQSK